MVDSALDFRLRTSAADIGETVERMQAWRCIGCSKIDAPQPCVGICQDRKVQFVYADDYDRLHARFSELESLVRILAQTMPRDGEWERSYLSLQTGARKLLHTAFGREQGEDVRPANAQQTHL